MHGPLTLPASPSAAGPHPCAALRLVRCPRPSKSGGCTSCRFVSRAPMAWGHGRLVTRPDEGARWLLSNGWRRMSACTPHHVLRLDAVAPSRLPAPFSAAGAVRRRQPAARDRVGLLHEQRDAVAPAGVGGADGAGGGGGDAVPARPQHHPRGPGEAGEGVGGAGRKCACV